MNVWIVVFQARWDHMDEGDFDELDEERVTVVAPDYDSALETARQVALAREWFDEEEGEHHHVIDVRLLSIERGQNIDAVAKSLANA